MATNPTSATPSATNNDGTAVGFAALPGGARAPPALGAPSIRRRVLLGQPFKPQP